MKTSGSPLAPPCPGRCTGTSGYRTRLGQEDIADRWSLSEGDFSLSVPAGDLYYLLKRILHDRNDEQSATILRNCPQAMAPGGRILVIDAVVPPGDLPHQSKTLDLMMTTSLVGRERTEEDFTRLFEEAGLRLRRIVPTPDRPVRGRGGERRVGPGALRPKPPSRRGRTTS
ncbi:methyltransferase [Streptomyces sp. NPDC051992]|uniref:methyltransferase n=1 Tax=Streptomyces sp. NPDC051992 TaxID=3161012 RepID=UPI0034313AD4